MRRSWEKFFLSLESSFLWAKDELNTEASTKRGKVMRENRLGKNVASDYDALLMNRKSAEHSC